MRINESRIRQIIREEVKSAVDEMAYAGSLGIRHNDQGRSTEAGEPNRPGAEKFARSGRFKKLAEKHLANIPHNVWFAPLIGTVDDIVDVAAEAQRMKFMPLMPAGIRYLESYGYEIPGGFSADDVVILYTSLSTTTDTLATPWMIFHAMFDSGPDMSFLAPYYDKLIIGIMNGRTEDPDLKPLWRDESWFEALTMRSAREGRVLGSDDAFAEIMCQELLTSGGVRFDLEKVEPDLADALDALIPHIKKGADEFRRMIKGKLIVVGVN
jgi:hypothetical protein